MKIQKKKKIVIYTYILVLLLFLSLGFINNKTKAATTYELLQNEKILDIRIIDNETREVFTNIDDKTYIRKLKKEKDTWVVKKSKVIKKKLAGLIIGDEKDPLNGIRKKNSNKIKSGTYKKNGKETFYGESIDGFPTSIDFSNSEYLPPVGEQKELSCVGWATGYYLRTFQQGKDIGWKIKEGNEIIENHVFSPTFIYNQLNGGVDGGANLNEAGELLKNYGVATLMEFPYIEEDFSTLPNESVVKSAYEHRIYDWKVLYTENDTNENIIKRTKESLKNEDLVVAGCRIGYNFIEPYRDENANSIITSESYILYNHAYLIVGYDDNIKTLDGNGAFKLINSWGKEWGTDGFSYISYNAFIESVVEGYVYTDLSNRVQMPMNLNLNDGVNFRLDFSGQGNFDYKILDNKGSIVCEQKDMVGKNGVNFISWNGRDKSGEICLNGEYKLVISPKNSNKAPFELLFNKDTKVKNVSCNGYSYEGKIYYIDIPIAFKLDSLLDLNVSYGEKTINIVKEEKVKQGESKVYRISNSKIDFGNIPLDKIEITVDVKE